MENAAIQNFALRLARSGCCCHLLMDLKQREKWIQVKVQLLFVAGQPANFAQLRQLVSASFLLPNSSSLAHKPTSLGFSQVKIKK